MEVQTSNIKDATKAYRMDRQATHQQKTDSDREFPKDAAGHPLRPFTQIIEPENDEKDKRDKVLYVKTQDLLDHITKNSFWDSNLIEKMKAEGKEVDFETVSETGKTSIAEIGSIPNHFPSFSEDGKSMSTSEREYPTPIDQVCENIIFSVDPKEKEACISFIPDNMKTENTLSIYSGLCPIPVTKTMKDGTELRAQHYSRGTLIDSLQKINWKATESHKNNFSLKPSGNPNPDTNERNWATFQRENPPITVIPSWAEDTARPKGRLLLQDHLDQGKVRNTVSAYIHYDSKRNEIQSNLPLKADEAAKLDWLSKKQGTQRTQRSEGRSR